MRYEIAAFVAVVLVVEVFVLVVVAVVVVVVVANPFLLRAKIQEAIASSDRVGTGLWRWHH